MSQPKIIDALDYELRRLEAELMLDARYRRAKRIRELLDDYRDDGVPIFEPNIGPRSAIPVSPTSGVQKAAAIKAAAKEYVHNRGGAHRSDILAHVVGLGLMGHEKNPMGSLAAYLSDWRDEFESDGRGNFVIKRVGASPDRSEEAP
jgi:hypothetical protein